MKCKSPQVLWCYCQFPHWWLLKWSEVKVAQSCPTLCDPMDYTVHGILQARILEWVAFPFSRGSSQPRDRTQVSRIAGRFFTSWATREAQEYLEVNTVTIWDHPPGVGVECILTWQDECVCVLNRFSRVWLFVAPWTVAHQAPRSMEILQARILEWVAVPSSRGSSQPRDQTHIFCIS